MQTRARPGGMMLARTRRRRRCLQLLVAGALAMVVVHAAAAQRSGVRDPAGPADAAIVDRFNAERAANGLPPVREDPAYSADCALHNAYMALNGVLTHHEDRRRPGYSAGGSWAGVNSVLAEGASWDAGTPWEDAPLHLIQLMSPLLVRLGVDERNGFDCVTTWPGYRDSPARRVYTFPGNGAADVPPAETADELPFTPQRFVGIEPGATTGRHLFAYGTGFGAGAYTVRVESATLRDATGAPIAIKTLDRRSPTVGAYLPPASVMIIPVAPLAAETSYRASVTLVGPRGKRLSHSWSFRTAHAG